MDYDINPNARFASWCVHSTNKVQRKLRKQGRMAHLSACMTTAAPLDRDEMTVSELYILVTLAYVTLRRFKDWLYRGDENIFVKRVPVCCIHFFTLSEGVCVY